MEVEWKVRPSCEVALELVGRCPEAAGLPELARRLLALRRHRDLDSLSRYLRPRLEHLTDPFRLPGMEAAVTRLLQAIDRGEKVLLYGDYDVDGVTSMAILRQVLAAFGLEAETFLPHRCGEGYGLSAEGLKRCLEGRKPDLLISVDCGTASPVEIRSLVEQGIDVIVVDHHEPAASGLPDCSALINPKLGDDWHYLCTAGLAFKVAHALLKVRPLPAFDLREMLDLVAVGTVADVVPLVEENRLLVCKGLHRLARTMHPGLRALMEVAGLSGPPTSVDIGYKLGPRLNAAGRLKTAETALSLLLSRDMAQALPLALELDHHNRERQAVQERVLTEAEKQLEDAFDPSQPVIVLGSRSWHPGVVGIVAGQLVRKYHRPCFVIAFDKKGMGKGSGRSIEGVSLVEAIRRCQPLLVKGGGHEMAAGLTVQEDTLPSLRLALAQAIAAQLGPEGLRPAFHIDCEARLHELDWEAWRALNLMEPFGSENHQPVLCCRGVRPVSEPQVLKDKHLRFTLEQDGRQLPAIWFNGAAERRPSPPWDVAFTFGCSIYREETRLQAIVRRVRPSAG